MGREMAFVFALVAVLASMAAVWWFASQLAAVTVSGQASFEASHEASALVIMVEGAAAPEAA